MCSEHIWSRNLINNTSRMAPIMKDLDRESKLAAFEATRTGVKGLADAGTTTVPELFILPLEHRAGLTDQPSADPQPRVPVIDLEGIQGQRRLEIVDAIREASSSWGMFYLVNHGVPPEVMNNMLEGNRQFHEQPEKAKVELYSRDATKKVRYYTSFHPNLNTLLWKDSISFETEGLSAVDVPLPCREALFDYVKHVTTLKDTLSALLSEALGLESDHLEGIACLEGSKLLGHYFPPCPNLELATGTTLHSDQCFLTLLVTNYISGLQVLHQDRWIDVTPMEGAFVVNIGDMLQVITNDLFKSSEHRVLAGRTGPRLSVACFFYPSSRNKDRKYGVIDKLLVGEIDRPPHEEISFSDYLTKYQTKGIGYPKSHVYVRH